MSPVVIENPILNSLYEEPPRYNGESLFVRHAYFTGAGAPYEQLRKALRADIDEAAWSTLYSTVGRPFDPPSPARSPARSSTTTATRSCTSTR